MPKTIDHLLLSPVLSVVRVPKGPDAGKFALLAHGKNSRGELTVVELRIFDTFVDARTCYAEIILGKIKAEDSINFDITPSLVAIHSVRYGKYFQN